MSSGMRELRVWQEAVSLAGDVVRAARQGMKRETRSVSDAAMLTALAVATHIADGYARLTPPEQRDSYRSAKRALLRLETELAVARHADILPAGAFTDLTARSALVAKLLTGYVAYLDRQIVDDAGRLPLISGVAEPDRTTPGSVRAPS